MDTSEYQVSDLGDVETYWENYQLDVDAVCRPGTDIPFSATAFDDLEMGESAEKLILPKVEEDSPPTTPVSKRATKSLHCWEVVHLDKE